MTEQKIKEHIAGLAGDYKCYNPVISHEEALFLYNILSHHTDSNHQKLDWIPIEKQPELPENGFYLITLKDDVFPEDAFWNKVCMIYYDLETKSSGWDSYKDRILAWAKVIPYHALTQRI